MNIEKNAAKNTEKFTENFTEKNTENFFCIFSVFFSVFLYMDVALMYIAEPSSLQIPFSKSYIHQNKNHIDKLKLVIL